MGTGLKYDSTRLIVVIFISVVVYYIALPSLWPAPKISVEVPERLSAGQDLAVTVTARAWHPNFRIRQVSFSIDGIASTGYASRKLFVPVTIYEDRGALEWSVGLGERSSWPRKRIHDLSVPTARLFRSGVLRQGTLTGSIDVEVEYTRVTVRSGYPKLTARRSVPFTLSLGP